MKVNKNEISLLRVEIIIPLHYVVVFRKLKARAVISLKNWVAENIIKVILHCIISNLVLYFSTVVGTFV